MCKQRKFSFVGQQNKKRQKDYGNEYYPKSPYNYLSYKCHIPYMLILEETIIITIHKLQPT